jgi:hypothetical protein
MLISPGPYVGMSAAQLAVANMHIATPQAKTVFISSSLTAELTQLNPTGGGLQFCSESAIEDAVTRRTPAADVLHAKPDYHVEDGTQAKPGDGGNSPLVSPGRNSRTGCYWRSIRSGLISTLVW